MSVQFDKSGFAAVDALFGGEEPSEVKREQPVIESSQRLGVGAKAVPKNRDAVTNKILQIGRKRLRENESHIEETALETEIQDENDEDELGRTAIDSGTKIATTSPAEIVSREATKKKGKKGKKERAQGKQSTNEEGGNQHTSANTESFQAEASADTDKEQKASSSKRKRRKVRSKQKNIYKDQREKKPEHLIVGNKNYQGRPLTAETRAKLNLPAPKSAHNSSFSGTWTGTGAKESDSKSESLAIEKAAGPVKDLAKKGMPKKPKFKNLK